MRRFLLASGILLVVLSFLTIDFASADTTVGSDDYLVGSDTTLASHTMDTGTGYTLVSRLTLNADASDDTVQGGTCGLNGSGTYIIGTANTSADYYIQVTMTNGDSGDDWNWLGLRVRGTKDGYWLRFNEDSSQIMEATAGSWANLGSAGGAIANGSVVKFEIIGSTLKAYDDGVEVTTATDSTLTLAGKAAIGMGEVSGNNTDDCSTQQLDNLSVVLVSAAATVTVDESYSYML